MYCKDLSYFPSTHCIWNIHGIRNVDSKSFLLLNNEQHYFSPFLFIIFFLLRSSPPPFFCIRSLLEFISRSYYSFPIENDSPDDLNRGWRSRLNRRSSSFVVSPLLSKPCPRARKTNDRLKRRTNGFLVSTWNPVRIVLI